MANGTATGFHSIGATTFLAPLPAVLLGCAADESWKSGGGAIPNLITVAWAGVVCSKPPMISVSIRPERFSHGLIAGTGEFTVNLIGASLCRAMDFCGVKSGRELNKFETLGLTPVEAPPLAVAPALAEAPAYLCCKVRQVLPLGSHDLFLAEIVDARVNESFLRKDGGVDEEAMELVSFTHGKYFAQGKPLGFFGYSVAGPEALRRRLPRKPGEQAKK
jgi:flavin reductase (DIM6/NTAB) family NADH-FMN oxidoreductase RutF